MASMCHPNCVPPYGVHVSPKLCGSYGVHVSPKLGGSYGVHVSPKLCGFCGFARTVVGFAHGDRIILLARSPLTFLVFVGCLVGVCALDFLGSHA